MISKIKNKNDNIAIALGGGVARGAFHLGVLDFCEQHNIDIKHIVAHLLELLLVHLMQVE